MRWMQGAAEDRSIPHRRGLCLVVIVYALLGIAIAWLSSEMPGVGFVAVATAAFVCGPFVHWALARAVIAHRQGEPARNMRELLRAACKRWRRLLAMSATGVGLLVPAVLLTLAASAVGRWTWAIAWAYLAAALSLLGWCVAHLVYENRWPLPCARRAYALLLRARAAGLRMLLASAVYAATPFVGLLVTPWATATMLWLLTPPWWILGALLYARAREEGEAYQRWILEGGAEGGVKDGAEDGVKEGA